MKVMRVAKKIMGTMMNLGYRCVYKWIPVQDKTILFISFHGKGYSDNPRAIYEELRRDPKFSDYTFLWAVKHHKKKQLEIPGAKIIEYLSVPYFFSMSRAKYWIFNCKMPDYIRKKEQQIYLQTWHGAPLKRLGHDIKVAESTTFYRSQISIEQMYRSYDVDVARYNYMISPNAYCTKIFQSAFAIDAKRLIETGYPRNDCLSNASADDRLAIKQSLQLPLDKKVLLYAPTWRDNQYVTKGYTFTLQADFKKWKEKLGEDYIVLFKPHYLIINTCTDDPALKDFLFPVDASADISSLYLIADALITDYSSVFFDYAILNRPIYFYMYDLNSYREELRGFYIDIYKDLPGAIYEHEDHLLDAISNQEYDYDKLRQFNDYFNEHEDGHAAKRVIDIVFQGR